MTPTSATTRTTLTFVLSSGLASTMYNGLVESSVTSPERHRVSRDTMNDGIGKKSIRMVMLSMMMMLILIMMMMRLVVVVVMD